MIEKKLELLVELVSEQIEDYEYNKAIKLIEKIEELAKVYTPLVPTCSCKTNNVLVTNKFSDNDFWNLDVLVPESSYQDNRIDILNKKSNLENVKEKLQQNGYSGGTPFDLFGNAGYINWDVRIFLHFSFSSFKFFFLM